MTSINCVHIQEGVEMTPFTLFLSSDLTTFRNSNDSVIQQTFNFHLLYIKYGMSSECDIKIYQTGVSIHMDPINAPWPITRYVPHSRKKVFSKILERVIHWLPQTIMILSSLSRFFLDQISLQYNRKITVGCNLLAETKFKKIIHT